MRSGFTEDLDNAGQCCVGPRPHVHRFGGQPDGVHSYHDRCLINSASDLDWSQGQNTRIGPSKPGSSIRASGAVTRSTAAGAGNAINAGGVRPEVPLRSAARRHFWTRLAFKLWRWATAAIEAPGCWASARTCALNWGECRRRRLTGVLISLGNSMVGAHYYLGGHHPETCARAKQDGITGPLHFKGLKTASAAQFAQQCITVHDCCRQNVGKRPGAKQPPVQPRTEQI